MSRLGNLTPTELTKRAKAEAKRTGESLSATKARMAHELCAASKTHAHEAEFFVLSYGMGVDSTAILLRYLEDGFEAHGIDPKRLTVLTAMTGNEFPELKALVEEHILPRLREHGVRYVQVARETAKETCAVLSDTTTPNTLHLSGAFTLRDECTATATIPQSGGCRKCSIKSKGWPLDMMIERLTGGRPYLHVIGFESEETGRAVKDAYCGTDARIPAYPLLDWGWNRAKCLEYIKERTGADWTKSACYFCPFFGQGAEKALLEERWTTHPTLGGDALYLEHTTLALNPRQTLFGKKSAREFAEKRGLDAALAAFEAQKSNAEWVVYRLRRIWKNGRATRGVDPEKRGLSEAEALETLREMAAAEGARVETDAAGITRAMHSGKPLSGTGTEHFLAASPVSMTKAKHGRLSPEKFEARWKEATAG